MRKISKNRVDADDADDVVSSTNGSVLNDDNVGTNQKHDDDDENDKNYSDDNANNKDSDDETLNNSKKAKGKKGRPKKKKFGKSRKSDKPDKHAESEEEEEYEVDKIMDSKKIKGKLHYLIRWKGYSGDSDTWEPENTLSCPDLISKYNVEKEASKSSKPEKRGRKRKAGKNKKETKSPAKRPKTDWDSENADENAEYEVDRILEVHHMKNGKRDFLIHWKGWSSKFDSWEPESNLNCTELIKKFMDKVDAAKTSDTKNLRVAPETTNRFTLQAPSSGRRLSKRRGQRQRVRYDDAE